MLRELLTGGPPRHAKWPQWPYRPYRTCWFSQSKQISPMPVTEDEFKKLDTDGSNTLEMHEFRQLQLVWMVGLWNPWGLKQGAFSGWAQTGIRMIHHFRDLNSVTWYSALCHEGVGGHLVFLESLSVIDVNSTPKWRCAAGERCNKDLSWPQIPALKSFTNYKCF